MRRGDFYEEDEPVQDLLTAFEQGDKVTTAVPEQGWGQTLYVAAPEHEPELAVSSAGNVKVG